MNLLGRVLGYAKSWSKVLLAPAADPRGDANSQARQQAFLQQIRLAQAQVAQARRQLQASADRLDAGMSRFEMQAHAALAAGRESVARQLLHRRQSVLLELNGLKSRIEEVEVEENDLALAEQQIATRLDVFDTQRSVGLARSQAQARIGRALDRVSRGVADLDLSLEPAPASLLTTTDASAVDHLTGLLEATSNDTFEGAIDHPDSEEEIEALLASMREQVVQEKEAGDDTSGQR